MKKVLMVIAPKDFRDEEFEKPYTLLKSKGIQVTIASSSKEPSKGMLGKVVKPELLLKDANMNDYDAIVFIGGSGAQAYFNDPTSRDLALKADTDKKIVAAICIAPSILANAGLLKGKSATCFESEVDNLREKGATYEKKPVVEAGRFITAQGPHAADAFAQALLKKLTEVKVCSL